MSEQKDGEGGTLRAQCSSEEENGDEGLREEGETSDGTCSSESSSSKKKKKKKNKKKKKGGGHEVGEAEAFQSQEHQQPALSKQERVALEKKFQTTLSDIKDSDDLWLNLSSSLIQDDKVEKLFERIKDNKSITSVDLSGNQISDAGAQAIGAMLELQGTAPELISLDLRDNKFTPAGLERLTQLGKLRSQIEIKLGSLSDPVLPPAEGKELKEVTTGPMFRKFFQGPGEEEEATTSQDAQADLPDISPAEMWTRITQLLKAGKGSIPELALSLQELAAILQHEFSQHTSNKQLKRLLKAGSHAKACLSNLGALQSVMALMPPDVVVQYSPQPQPAVGSHRVWASAVVALLLTRGHRRIDQTVSKSHLAIQVVQLALQRPLCNTLHTKALHVLHACVNSQEDALLAPMLQEAVQESGSTVPNLLEVLVDLGSAAVEVECGQRSSLLGFVIGATRILQGMCNEPPGSAIKNQNVKRALQANARWSGFVKPKTGAFSQLCAEQDAELGGPRPSAPLMGEYGNLGGGLMSSSDILAMIESMNMG